MNIVGRSFKRQLLFISTSNSVRSITKSKLTSAMASVIDEFFKAVRENDVEKVVNLVKNQKVDVNHRFENYDFKTATHIAAVHYDLTLLKILVDELKSDLEVQDNFQQVPIQNAACHTNYDSIKFLLSRKPEHITKVKNYVNTPEIDSFFEAVKNGELNKVREILEKENIDVNVPNKSNHFYTALHTACENRDINLVKMLVDDFNADIYVENTAEDLPEHMTDDEEIINFLKSKEN